METLESLIAKIKKVTKCENVSVTLNYGNSKSERPVKEELTPEQRVQMEEEIRGFLNEHPTFATLRDLAKIADAPSRYISKCVHLYNHFDGDNALTLWPITCFGRTIRFVDLRQFLEIRLTQESNGDHRVSDAIKQYLTSNSLI